VPAAVPYLGAVLCVGMVVAQLFVPSLG